jgi:hypothetical protein
MMTEKAIGDFAYCPMLLKDPEAESKRFKPDRSFCDEGYQLIRQAVTTGNSNKRAFASRTARGCKASAYDDKGMWLVVPCGEQKLLLAITYLELFRENSWKVLIVREQKRKKPRGEDQLEAEYFVRVALYHVFKEDYETQQLTVRTTYQGTSQEVFDTTEPSFTEVIKAEQYFQQIADYHDGMRVLPAKLERCEYCFWNKKCPKAQVQPSVNPLGPASGGTTQNLL